MTTIAASHLAFLQDGGQMGALMRSKDWSRTPLGPPEGWPQSLRTAVAIMLRTRQPMFIGWGTQLISLYNDGYIPICGEKHPDGLGLPMSQLWSEIWDSLEPINAAVLRGDAQWFQDMPFALTGRGHAEVSYFSFSYTPLLDDSGSIAGIFCAAAESTEKIRAEQQRAEEVASQQRMFKQAPGFMCTLRGPEHVFVSVNDAYARLFGRPDAVGRAFREVFPDLAGQGFYELLDRVYETGQRYVARGLVAHLRGRPDGPEEHRRLDFIYAPMFESDGTVSGIFCEGHDVTEAFAVQRALEEREEQLRLAIEAAEIGLWDVDVLADRLFWPSRVKAMFGLPADSPVSLADFYDGLHPADRDATLRSFAAACDPALRALYDVEYRTVGRMDGEVRWVAAKGRGLFDDTARCVRVIGTAIDITSRKSAEAKLRESEEKLRVSDRRKDEFLATLAHELRNPLAPLRTSLQLLRAQGETRPVHEIMERQVAHLVRLVDDLLEISRISRGTFELRREPVDMSLVLRNAMEASDALIKERGHAVETEIPDERVWVDGDAVRLAQIVGNLLNNAARYTDPGGLIRLTLRKADHSASVAVRDSGMGFRPDDREQLFEMFRRGERSTGLGIGLALSRQLAEMHGGTLVAESEGPGQGAEFVLRLALATSGPTAAVATGLRTRVAPVRVLVVDDNRDAADTMGMLLRELGGDVRVAHDGPSALEQFASFRPALTFVDIGMPGMDGYEVVARLRARFGREAGQVVALSGWGQSEDVERGRAAGFDHHLVKPADLDAVEALLIDAARQVGDAVRRGDSPA